MIDARDFIKQSLLDVLLAIRDAQDEREVGHHIAPSLSSPATIDPAYKVAWHDGHLWTTVEFDLAVTAKTVTEGGGKVGFKIPIIEAGAELGADHQVTKEGISRMKFSVPIRISEKTD
ncbi:MAG: hypothetical protein ABJ388_07940 [Alphaproteobacteria bacterium]